MIGKMGSGGGGTLLDEIAAEREGFEGGEVVRGVGGAWRVSGTRAVEGEVPEL